ncbi:SpoIIE family protein phosphatase [Nocardioides sp. BP30]|uniref:PP2C family protein-serine/threonine phosphatase n=1 Tax=Nocardioides sp. BP30 TaxID=3036374 RepID=UPI0024683606|nr:SpoIIE family protein phosphatase [Nocardioides sp. BP30]WGL51851.1 SpoIIE family protein phosphatase [Nocardioides sp. BP30]
MTQAGTSDEPLAAPREVTAPAPARASGWDWSDPTVLLVEDDPGDALLVEELVADCHPPMSLRHASSLAEATALLADLRPDCVLLDLHLPDAQGLDALTVIQDSAETIAVVVLTGQSEEEIGLAAMAAGAQDYLVKGHVDAEWLGRAVRYAMQRKEAERSAVALHASQLLAQENARLERGLLPKPLIGTTHALEVVSRYQPGRAQALLGGDFYDVIQLSDGTVEVLIGDVSGHGPDEAALGVALRIAWRTLVLSGIPADQRVGRLEQILIAERPAEHTFATLTCVTMLPDRQRVRVVRAGHPGLMVRTADSLELIEVSGGPAIGILPDSEWEAAELVMPGAPWGLVLFTDGLFEGRTDLAGNRLGEDGLLTVGRELTAASSEDFVDSLVEHAQRFSEGYGGLEDDLALLHLRWHEGTEARR